MGKKISQQEIIQRLASLQRIIFTDEVLNYLCNQTAKEAAKIIWMIRLLDEEGLSLPDNYLHRLFGTEKLWELRIQFANNYHRVLFFVIVDGKFLLTHCYRKEKQRIPEEEIKKAKRIYMEFIEKARGRF